MSAWNLSAEKIHVLTPMASVKPVKTTALPVPRGRRSAWPPAAISPWAAAPAWSFENR